MLTRCKQSHCSRNTCWEPELKWEKFKFHIQEARREAGSDFGFLTCKVRWGFRLSVI